MRVTTTFTLLVYLGILPSSLAIAQEHTSGATDRSWHRPELDHHMFELKVEFDRSSFRLGEPILANVEMTNVSAKSAIVLQTGDAEEEYSVIIKNELGEVLPFTAHGSRLRPNKGRSLIQARHPRIAPLHSVKGLIDLTQIVEITKPGLYTVVISRQTDEMLFTQDMGWFKAVSQPQQLIVVP